MDTTLVAIDSSTSCSGIAIYKNAILTNVSSIKSTDKIHSKCDDMCIKLAQFLNKTKPHIIVIETPSVVRNANTQRALTMVYGVVYGWALANNCEFNPMRPTEWRKWCGLNALLENGNENRKELKKMALEYAKQLFPQMTFDTEDSAEAALLGFGYINWFQEHVKRK